MTKAVLIGSTLALAGLLMAAHRTQPIAQQPCIIVSPTPAASVADQIAGDMQGQHEGHPYGVPSYWDGYDAPLIGMGNNPAGNRAMVYWGVVQVDTSGLAGSNTRVNIRRCQIWWLRRSTNTWVIGAVTDAPDAESYKEDYSAGPYPADLRNEPDGTISVKVWPGRNAHTYAPWPRVAIDPNDIGGIVALCEMRLILDRASGPDDRDSVRLLGESGADYYPATTGPGIENNPSIGAGKLKYVKREWRSFGMATLSQAQLESNPPPISLEGVLP